MLVADDDRSLRESCGSVLGVDGYQVTLAAHGEAARELLKRRSFDIALIDWYLNDVSGVELLRTALTRHAGTRVIAMTGKPSLASSLEALQSGAWDYLPKPFSGTHLQILVGRAAHALKVERESRSAELPSAHAEPFTVLGTSSAFRQAIALARRVAASDASVFITGESGSGKELIARVIHTHSRRSNRPFMALNCAALPETLLESEMFGHVKGAFTGAIRDKPGLLETANGGTLFLDELIEMPKPIQAKLLRVIQDGVVRRLGSERTDAVVNVRYVAATNGDPQHAVDAGLLREDLYYRLRVVPIHVPPLRERPEDITPLANHFLAQYWRRHRDPKLPLPTLTRAAVRALRTYPWRGNVRELQNVIEHAVVLLAPGTSVQPEDIPFMRHERADADREAAAAAEAAAKDSYYAARDELLAKFDRRFLTQVLVRAGGNLSKAARLAQVDRTTFYRLMERHSLDRDVVAGESQ